MFEQVVTKVEKVFIPCAENGYRPKILASNFLVYFLLVLAALKLVSLGFLLEFPKTGFFAEVSKNVLIELLNKERGELGLGQLTENPKLSYAARLKAQDMLQEGYFSHQSPKGVTPWHWFGAAGYNYHYAGENLGIGFLESEEIHKAWNDSPTHQTNLLNANYKEIGIAVLRGEFQGTENTVVVQLFGTEHPAPPVVVAVAEPEIETKPGPEPQAAAVVQPAPEPPVPKPAEIASAGTETSEASEGGTAELVSWQGAPSSQFAGTTEEGLKLSLFRFMAFKYHNLLERLIFYSLLGVAVLLFINIFVKISIQHKGLTIKVLGILALFALCVYLNKDIMLKFIPHIVSVY